MLKPEYFTGKEERLLELYKRLEEFIMKDIAGRLLKSREMSGTADRLLWKLRQMGESREEIQKKLMQLTGLSNKELKAILQDAVLTSWEDDRSTYQRMGIEISSPLENAAVVQVMDAEYKKSMGELRNLTRTTMDKSQIDLMNMLDEAEIRTASGAQSYSAAVCDILDRYAESGIKVKYPKSGREISLEAAVRMCVVTSMNQTAAQVTNQYIVEAGSEYVLVSRHEGARHSKYGGYVAQHDLWQGKVYKIRGEDEKYPNLLASTGYDIDPVTGKGTTVNLLGLHGYNCRHSHQGWDISLRNPYEDENVEDNEKSRKLYDLQQKQRYYEREIRATKLQLLMKETELNGIAETDVKEILQPEYDKLAYKLRMQNQKYNEFCAENDLQKQYDRIKVAGFHRKQSAKANGAATRYTNKKQGVPH